ncbi:MAG: hypothetical protein Q7T01_03615 [bacterium]|nr:hypothetical protein [bacterium]
MSEQLRGLGRKVTDRLNSENAAVRRRWQAIIGVTFMFVFVVASVAVNQTVLALNQAAGNYGYVSGTYGYNVSATSSDALPSAPTSLGSTPTVSGATVTWTAPTTTTDSTSLDNLSSYRIHYSTSSLSSCSGGTSTTSSSASATLSSLSSNTAYYVAVCAIDGNSNESSALTGTFTTVAASSSGGGGAGAGGVFSATPATPATAATPGVTPAAPATPATPSAVAADGATLVAHLVTQGLQASRNIAAETTNATKVAASASEFKVTLAGDVKTVAANFVTYGTNATTVKLGSGERLAVIRDVLQTLGSTVQSDAGKLLKVVEEISSGNKPSVRNIVKEREQVAAAKPIIVKFLNGREPNFKNTKEDLAWNTLLYRVRFERDLVKERAGIVKFKADFKRIPKTPLDWAAVRAWAYALK